MISFSPDIIPPLVALPITQSSAFEASHDVINAHRMLEQLSAGATSAENASKRCQQTLLDVQRLLDPASLTHFKFKASSRPSVANNIATENNASKPGLSSFANMVLGTSKVPYRYLTPDSPEPQVKRESDATEAREQAALPTPKSRTKEAEQHQLNSHSTPRVAEPPTGSQGSRLRAVIVPKTLTPAQRAEYLYTSEADSMFGAQQSPSNKKHESDQANGKRMISSEQKHNIDVAVHSLQSLLNEIFEAEDQLQPDTSGAAAVHESTLFAVRDTDDGSALVLRPDTQAKLDYRIQKAIANACLEEVGIESLAHAQRLCEVAILAAEPRSFAIGVDWSDSDAEEWTDCIAVAERGMVAARTLLRVIGASSHKKELQSEDFLRIILTTFTTVLETCIVPIVEDRLSLQERLRGSKEESPRNPKFAIAVANRKPLQTLLHASTKSFRILGDYLTKNEVDETALSSVEALCRVLIFAENASNERDSVFGIQNFETTRRCAMDVLAKIFAKHTEQRQSILTDILMSLEKLPGTKQSARQFRLVDAKPIQLVSALLMRLVQTSATHGGGSMQGRSKGIKTDEDGSVTDSADEEEDDEDEDDSITVEPKKARSLPVDLLSIVKPLHDAAQSNASFVVKILLQRALVTSKSSDEPYRKLLDIFTEDFLNVLGSSDWPSAEMLLRTLVSHMIGMIENPKSAVPSRVLALELLGTIGSGILELQMSTRNAVRSLESSDVTIGRMLTNLAEELEMNDIEPASLVAFDGPYRVVIEYIRARDVNDAQLRSAQGYHLMQWSMFLCGGRESSIDSDSANALTSQKDLQRNLENIILDPHWLEEHHDYPAITTGQGRLAAMVVTLSSNFCKAFKKIFNILLMSMSSEHSTVKSRSLKSVVTLLEKDPSVLDRNAYVLNHIFRCANDPSPLVRDSALKLIGECTNFRPALDKTVYDRIIARTRDAAPGVRKRAIKLLKDIYLRNDSSKLQLAIATAILARIEDTEESVAELGRHTMEEIWFMPLHGLKLDGEHVVEAKLRYGAQAALLIRTIEASDSVSKVLEALIRGLLDQPKMAAAHSSVCTALVRVLFDGIIDNSDIPGAPEQPSILRCLATFANASPTIFNAAQLERLEPYTQNLTKTDDLYVYRSVITILRHVMPQQSMLKPDFLQKLQTSLMSSVAKLPKSELGEVVPCLWTINSMLGNTERLVNYLASALQGVYGMRAIDFTAQPQAVSKCCKLLLIAGQFGKACDFEAYLATFKSHFSWYKGNSVAGLIAEVSCPFTSPKQPLTIREVSLEAVCMVSQSWAKLLLRSDVVNSFETVFKDRIPSLEEVLLSGLERFFGANEISNGATSIPALGTGIVSGTERLGRTYVATDQDGASTSIAQRFLPQILRLALKSCDDIAFIAAKLVVSINRQGLVHPKESGPALVALETCPSAAIAHMAFVEHKALHSRHETLFDKEYMRAVQQAFEYQKGTIGSSAGFIGQPPVAKMNLLWEVLKTGKAQVRKKFIGNICQKLDFDLNTLDIGGAAPKHLEYVRFCVENLAFFDYDRVEELAVLITVMEKIFAGTGTVVAQAIESEVFKLQVDMPATTTDQIAIAISETLAAAPSVQAIDPKRLLQLAFAAQICSLIWETRTFIRRLWNMQKYMNKPKNAAKESSKAPNRATNASSLAEAYIKRVAEVSAVSMSEDRQLAICSAFLELINVDSDVKVGPEDEDNGEQDAGYETPSERASSKGASVPPPSGGGRGRKRKSVSVTNTPRKKGRASMGKKKSGSAKLAEDDEEGEEWD